MKKIISILIILLSVSVAKAQSFDSVNDNPNVLVDATKKELTRSFEELKKGEYAPYFISYQMIEKQSHKISARFGNIVSNANNHTRQLDIDLRVGTPKLDNTHQIRGNYDFGSNIGITFLPLEDAENVIRNAIWFSTDAAYTKSIEKFEKAKANDEIKVAAEDTSADFSIEKPSIYSEPFRKIYYYNEMTKIFLDPNKLIGLDTNAWSKKLKDLSNKFVQYTWILDGNITLFVEIVNKLFVNTEGSEIMVSEPAIRLMVNAKCKAMDGMSLPLYKSYFGFNIDELPSVDSVGKDIDNMIELLDKLRNAELATSFIGPAMLSGEASGVFFHEIFGHRVEGFREKDADATAMFKNMIGQKVLPEFMNVYFDPSLKTLVGTSLSGYFKYDDEGIKGEKVETVKNGIFQNFLMSRSPIEGFSNSNGHGRKAAGRSVVTRQSNLIVAAEKTHTISELKKLLIEEAKKQEKEYGLYFTKVAGGFTMISRWEPNAFNVTPLVVYKVYVDGRPDELVRGVDLIGTPLTTFSKIFAAGNDMGIFNGTCGAESGWVPVSACSPTLLVLQIEVQKKPKSQAKPPLLPSPLDDKGGVE
jgi:predicted Zn-dependent protease